MRIPLTTCDFLRRAALVYGDRTGIIDEPSQPAGSLGAISYRLAAELAARYASLLDVLNIGFGERVAIVSQNSARLLLALYGVTGSGRVLVPINFRLTAAEVEYIVDDCGAAVLLVDPELADVLAGLECRRIVLGEEWDRLLDLTSDMPVPWVRDENALATINYTSGTTARPKGVQLTHRNLWINAAVLGLHACVTDRDVYLHTLPTFHCNGWGMPFIVAAMGVPQVILRTVRGSEVLRRIERHGVTLLCGAPTVIQSILNAARDWLGPIPGRGKVRVVVAGAPSPTATIARVESELGWEFIQIYGLTETAPLLTINRMRAEYDGLDSEARARRLGRAGAPAIGAELGISGEGEVLARGNMVFDGYWRHSEATVEAVHEGWFHTGDGGSIDTEGYLAISDRKKDMIITGGENVASIEIEDVLLAHSAVAEVAVVGVPDDKWGETVKALVVLAKDAEATEHELIEHCRACLSHYKCPTSVEFRAELARNATGKLQKFKLRAPYWNREVSCEPAESPGDGMGDGERYP